MRRERRQAALLCVENVSLAHGRSSLLHCALQTRPWSTEAAVCTSVRLQCLPTTSTRNCNCETFPQFSAHLDHCPHNNGHIHNLSRDYHSLSTKTYPHTSARFPSIIDQTYASIAQMRSHLVTNTRAPDEHQPRQLGLRTPGGWEA